MRVQDVTDVSDQDVTFHNVRDWFAEHMHPDVLDFDDQKVYEYVYHAGRWGGIFQLTSSGAQQLFTKAQPRSLVDIATLTSIYRPGPLAAEVDKLYLKHATGEPYKWGHPSINKTLEKTKGLIIFQEQVMQLANEVAGFPQEECDEVRRAIMKRSISGGAAAVEKANELRDNFVKGSVARGVPFKVADDLYDKILYFSGYGFNASHAISYAMDSYFCAWLMTYYEDEWLCAYLESMSTNDFNRAKAFSEVRSLGYKIAPIDVNYAAKGWTIMPDKRFMPSFTSCKGVGDVGVDELMRFRPFRSLEDMLWDGNGKWRLSKFNKKCLDALIKVGGFESLDIVGPGKMFTSYRHMHEVVVVHVDELKKQTKKEPFKGQKRFYELVKELAHVKPWSREENIKHQVEHFGSIDINRLIPEPVMQRLVAKGIPSIDEHEREQAQSCWFVVSGVTKKTTRNGNQYLLLNAVADGGKDRKVYMWRWDGVLRFKPYELVVAFLEPSDFGFSTSQKNLAVIDVSDTEPDQPEPEEKEEEDDDLTDIF
jgi:DNA polymerase-3 subunit alpha